MSIFEEDKDKKEIKTPSQGDDANVNKQFGDLLSGIKNDSGEQKYGTVELALEALKHSQEYIPALKKEKTDAEVEVKALQEQQSKIDNLTAIVEKLTAKKEEQVYQPDNSLGEQDVAKLVQQALASNALTQTKESNVTEVTTALKGKFGTEAEKEFYGKAEELGMTKEAFNELAATSPKAVMAMFGGVSQKVSLTGGSQNVNHSFTQPKQDGSVSKSEKSIMAGATSRDLMAELQRHKQAVYAKHGVTH